MFSPESNFLKEKKEDLEDPNNSAIEKLKKKIDFGTLTSSLEKILNKVDFEMIKDICSGVLRKAGVESSRAEKISSQMVNNKAQWDIFLEGAEAVYSTEKDKIIFYKAFYRKFEIFLNTLIHELIHVVSDNERTDSVNPEDYIQRTGIDEQIFGGRFLGLPYYKNFNILLNEGVTQLLSEAITHEYFRRKGVDIEDIRLLERDAYLSGKAVVELLTKSIAYRTGVSEDAVFKAITRSMLNYDYDEFSEMIHDDPILKELVTKISSLGDFELENFLGRIGIGHKKVSLNKLKVKGLENVFESIITGGKYDKNKKESIDKVYFNPLYGNLH